MSQAAGVLKELALAKAAGVVDALGRGGGHVGGVARVPVHREALLQGQLKPIAAGHAISSPVVKVCTAAGRLDL